MGTASNQSTPTRRWLKWTALGLLAVVVVVAGALTVAFYNTDWSKHVSIVADQVKAATGRELKIQGRVSLGLFPPRVIANDVRLANAPWGSRPEMFTAHHMDLSVSYAGLVRGVLDLHLVLEGSDLLLERSKKGVSNWELKRTHTSRSVSDTTPAMWSIRIAQIDLRQVVVTTRLGPKESSQRYAIDALHFGKRDRSALDVRLVAQVNDSPVQLTGVVGDVYDLLEGHAPTAIEVEGDVAGVRVTTKGSLANMEGKDLIDATLVAHTDDLPALGKLIGIKLPDMPPTHLETHLRLRDLVFHFSKFHLSSGKNSSEGNWILDVNPDIPYLRGAVRLSIADLPTMGKMIGVELPATQEVMLDTHIAERDRVFSFSKVRLSSGENSYEGDLTLDLNPDIPRLRGIARLSIPDLPALGKVIGVDLPAMPAIKLDTHFAQRDRVFTFSKFRVSAEDSAFSGDWTLDINPQRPRIRGVVDEASVDVPQLSRIVGTEKVSNSADDRGITDSPWPTDALYSVDLFLKTKVSRMRVAPKLQLEDVRSTLQLVDGRLSIGPLTMPTHAGNLAIRVSLDSARGRPPQVRVAAQGTGIDLENVMNILGNPDLVKGGPTDLAIDLRGIGPTPMEVMKTLNGYVRIVVGTGQVKNNAMMDMMGGIFRSILNAINPIAKKEPYSKLECLVVNVPVQSGVVVVQNNIALETDKLGVSSAGEVNLGKQELDLAIKPKAKPVLSVGLTDLAGMVRVRGPWADPKVEVDAEGTAKSVSKLWVDIATGGATWLADKLIFTPYVLDAPCKAALKDDSRKQSQSPEKDVDDVVDFLE